MRIAFNGKGGSGKTTLSALFIRHLERLGKPVLAIDADVNEHLHTALGLEPAKIRLGSDYQAVATYFEGNRKAFRNLGFDEAPELGTIPPGHDSRFVRLGNDDPFLSTFSNRRGALWAITVGGHDAQDAGDSCYHVKLNSAELLLHRTLERKDEWVVVDTTAGVDSVGTSLVTAYDVFVFALEPTAKSLSVFQDFQRIVANAAFPVHIVAIPNKVRSPQDMKFLQQHIPAQRLLPPIRYSNALRRAEQGQAIDWTALLDETADTWAAVATVAQQHPRDWEAYYHAVRNLYVQRCDGWWNSYTGRDMSGLAASSFRYADVMGTEVSV